MITIFDRAAMAHVFTLDLSPQLRGLLERRFAALATRWGDLTDWTEWVILEPGDTEGDIVEAVGLSPLVEPIDGARFGDPAFQPLWDHLIEDDGHFVFVQSFGSAFAYVLIIPDMEGIIPELLDLCRKFSVQLD